MNVERPCPLDGELADLLSGNLADPKLSELVEHLEHCPHCIHKVEPLTSQSRLATALRSATNAIDTIANQTPRQLVERVKQIPMLAPLSTGGSERAQAGDTTTSREAVVFPPDPTPGSLGRLGPYRILKLLGSGGMGSVFLAEDTRLNRHVSVKVMSPRITLDPIAKQRFLREARAAASLKSDHIVTVHQVDEADDIPYLAMELLEGRSLDEAIRSATTLDLDTIIHVALGVARGLADAHEKGLIHRDIKPGNIWLERSDEDLPRVKLLDFGLARTEVDDTHLTHAFTIVGTPAFMSPEQARGEKSTDARSDLFSLGCVLYYMCTGEVPFKAESTLGTLMALAVDTPVSPADRNPAVPAKLSRLTMQLLEKDPSRRPQTAREVATTIREVKRELDSGEASYAPLASQTNSYNTLPPKTQNRSHSFGVIVAVGLLALVSIEVWNRRFPLRPSGEHAANNSFSAATGLITRSDEKATRANERLSRLSEQFQLSNPEFAGTIQPEFDNGELVALTIKGRHIVNLDALQGANSLKSLTIDGEDDREFVKIDIGAIHDLSLTDFRLYGGYTLANLDPLRGMPLEHLAIDYSPIVDLTPLAGMPLRKLLLWSWKGSDLTPLRGMPLEELNVGGNDKPMDLSPLAGSRLAFLCINLSQVSDLAPLQGMPLRRLYCSNTRVSDLSPVKDAPIEEMMCEGTHVNDISIANGWPLTWIEFDYEIANWHAVLKNISTLERIKDQPADALLAEFDPERWPVRKPAFVNQIGMEFVRIPSGKTLRSDAGSERFAGTREIEIAQDFYLGRYEVTQAEWTRVMGTNPSHFSREGQGAERVRPLTDAEIARLPVEQVSWFDCQEFLKVLNALENESEWMYRLPTEAEWVYACQGGPMPPDFDRNSRFYFDRATMSLLAHKANTRLSGRKRTCRVGVYAPNILGLFDMHGNVFEWCDDLADTPNKRSRWIHGGGWTDGAERCDVSSVADPTESWAYFDLGLRVARVKKE